MRIMAAATAALALSGTALADTTSHYTVLFQDRVVGSDVATVRGDGGVDVQMSYRNNGRGPDLKEHSRFAPDGTLLSFEVKGKSTFGAPIYVFSSRRRHTRCSRDWSSDVCSSD